MVCAAVGLVLKPVVAMLECVAMGFREKQRDHQTYERQRR